MNTPWLKNTEETYYPPLKEDLNADVCVVGGGITGITTAYLLQEAGRRVILLEANKIATGVTGHTSGHLTSFLDAHYHNVISSFGELKAIQLLYATLLARETVEFLMANNAIVADYERVPAYYYATNDDQVNHLKKERNAMDQLGAITKDADLTDIPFKCKKAFRIDNQATLNAAGFVKGLTKAFVEKGGQIFEQTRVVNFKEEGEQIRVKTEEGSSVKAKYIVQATHIPINENPLQLELKNHNSYVMAGESGEDVAKGLFYDFAEPYHYTRNYEENGKSMFIVGGFDQKTGEKLSDQNQMDKLRNFALENLNIKEMNYSWCSTLFTSPDGLPLIGKDPIHKNSFIATGFAGDGLTYSIISAILNTALITKGSHNWEELFDPKRLSPSTLKTAVNKGVTTIKHLVADKFGISETTTDDMKPNSAKVIHKDGENVAVYKDENGELHTVSALCTHMGCVVHFNNVAKTWDCGCHGSRFGIDGKVLAGPATEKLESINIFKEQ
ncbi:glycine/D-amino acid oxidase, deaminating [Owenweeksia hongkongensis DSM 17368]|uniref:Glycine/D-amino acid oxidase, deaminating n=1 Tax=Owenweeksia hongkongensis (strain DSM 17368 / CIP 108786 / JCM 12287 / NRRL B-23963 / UST20020801) TaxID=926562 RepID=G8R4M8_OWEHD|nr:FAD-dependent oxidoreductase [Owenweeksia hongkongensis]AEV32117.1 glycine/D-amino acid oxidase, deaminating [Owenweeksia hongkongensis DSM 17368]